MCSTEMSTISKTNPNSNQSSKTNDGLNPLPDLPPISTLTPPVTIYGVSPQLYIGQNGSSRSTFAYTTSTLQITTQDNSYLKLDANNSYLNKSLAVHTGTTAAISVGVSPSNAGTILYAEYSPGLWLLQLYTQYGTSLELKNDLVVVNKDLQVLKIVGSGQSIIFNLQNSNYPESERQAVFKYTEILPTIDDEGAQLEISVPGNTRAVPTTPGSTINLLQDKIQTTSPLDVYGTNSTFKVGVNDSNTSQFLYSDKGAGNYGITMSITGGAKLEVNQTSTYTTNDFTLFKASANISFIFQNNTLSNPTERYANISYFETGGAGTESGALSIAVPANTRSIPATAGSTVTIQDDIIYLESAELQLQIANLNSNSYIYLDNSKSLTNTQPAPLSWTPTIVFTTPGTNSIAYTTQYGRIWKYGNVSYVNFRILATITITGSTNLRITNAVITYPAVTNPSNIKMGPASTVAGVRYDTNCISELGQTNPSWIITLLFNGGGLPAHAAWIPGNGVTALDFYGDGWLCHG